MRRSTRSDAVSAVEALEPRQLLSFVYQDFGSLVGTQAPDIFAEGYRGPVVMVGDVNGDGVGDVLVGNAGLVSAGSPPGSATGAALFSGATGDLIRMHQRAEDRFGWYAAALGDVNDDGTPDYGLGSGMDGASAAFVFSGATGDLLHMLTGNATGGATIGRAGDLDDDGHADVVVGYIGENRAVAYSGADGGVLYEYMGDTGDGIGLLGIGVGGGRDFNADGRPDFIVAGHRGDHPGTLNDPFELVLYVYSGINGNLLTTIERIQGRPDGSELVPALTFDVSSDFNADGVNDLLFAAGNEVWILDVTTGETILPIRPAINGTLQSAVSVGDVDGDGTPDFAAGLPTRTSEFADGQVGAVWIYSGANGVLLSVLSDQRASSANARLGTSLAYGADLDQDGLPDLLAVGDQRGSGQDAGNGRVYMFSGERLTTPTPTGFATDAAGNAVAWGLIRDRGFLVRNNQFYRASELNGFGTTDVIIRYAETQDGVVILGAADAEGNSPFIWRSGSNFVNGTRMDITGFTETGGAPAGTYLTVVGMDLNSAGDVLVYRRRAGFGATAWLYDPDTNTMMYLFDGTPVAVNESGNVVGINPAATGSIFWTPMDQTEIDGFIAGAMNDNDVILGQAQRDADTEQRAYTWQNGTFTAIPLIDGGSDFTGVAINNDGVVVGRYRTELFTISMFEYDPATMMTVDAKTTTDVDAPVEFVNATNFSLLGVNEAGEVMGQVPGTGTIFLLRPYDAEGPFIVAEDAIISSAMLGDGGLFVTTRNPAGEVIAFYRSPLDGPWRRVDLAHAAGVARLNGEVVAWYDAQEDRTYIAAASMDGLLLISQLEDESWEVRNLTSEIAGATAIVDSLIDLQPQNGLTLVGGLTADGDLVIYGQTLQTNGQGQIVWAYDNLSQTVIRDAGLPEPDFNTAERGKLISYETPWDGLNIVGSGAGGQPIAIWTAPGIAGWRITNLSDSTTNPAGHSGLTHLTAYITSWGGINLVSGDDLKVLWWVPGFEGEWMVHTLRTVANGPLLRGETLSAYFAPWGGLNIAGLDDENRLWVYWWTPQIDQWFTTNMTNIVSSPWTPTGSLSTLAMPNALNIFARTEAGDLLHFFWQPDQWTVTNVSLTAVS